MYFESAVQLIFWAVLKFSMLLYIMFVPEYNKFFLLGG